MKTFIDFCKGIASDVDIRTMVEDQNNLPDNEKMNPIMKGTVISSNYFEGEDVPFAVELTKHIIREISQDEFENTDELNDNLSREDQDDLDEVEEVLEDVWNSDIPIGLSCYISEALYKKNLKDLTDDEASIIKVLTIYSMIL